MGGQDGGAHNASECPLDVGAVTGETPVPGETEGQRCPTEAAFGAKGQQKRLGAWGHHVVAEWTWA